MTWLAAYNTPQGRLEWDLSLEKFDLVGLSMKKTERKKDSQLFKADASYLTIK